MYNLKHMPSHEEHLLRQERLCCNFTITGNATPANKTQQQDVVGLVVLRMQGQTAAADAVEALTWTTPVDNSGGNSVFGILLDLDENKADKVYCITLTEVSNLSTSEVVTGPNGSSSFLTAEGNIAIEIAALGLSLASESPTFNLVVEYREARD